jgi:hypothetical protein
MMNYLTLSYLSSDKLLIKLSQYKGLSYIEKVSYFSYFQNYILSLSLINIIIIIILIIIISY